MTVDRLISGIEQYIFGNRKLVLTCFAFISLIMLLSASYLKIDAGFTKLLPLDHEYMKTYIQYRDEFGGANRILVALIARDGNIFTPEFFESLKNITDEIYFIHGVDKARVKSLFTPNVRFTEVIEDGITGGNVIPDDFKPTEEYFTRVRENVLKSGILGRLVANDFSGAMISAELHEIDPDTGQKLDYVKVANLLEKNIRHKYDGRYSSSSIDIHIIGFAKVIGDIANGVKRVLLFFLITLIITTLLIIYYTQSVKIALIPIFCSIIAVVWQLGLLQLLGYGIDPMSILVPFLIFAIGVSHGIQVISAMRAEIYCGAGCEQAARSGFRRLVIPGTIALLSDFVGFITIMLIKIDIIQEMAITASLGVAVIILTNLILLPVVISMLKLEKQYQHRLNMRARHLFPVWNFLAKASHVKQALGVITVAFILLVFGIQSGAEIKIGDQQKGVPELHKDSQYNIDTNVIADKFSIGVDLLTVIAETRENGCVNYETMKEIDNFNWYILNSDEVQSAISLPVVAKQINAGWNEGHPRWQVLPRNQSALTQSVSYIPTSSGLLNNDCSVMPVHIFTRDHKEENISKVINKINNYVHQNNSKDTQFRLATGNVGILAATNDEVEAAQFPILVYVFSAIFILCLITFRSIRGTLCIIIPLVLVSLLTYALMSILKIGLKVNTLPVVALGIGVGVDYGIYIYHRFTDYLRQGKSFSRAYLITLQSTGFGVLFTALTLALGVLTWIFSPLKFQADMGILLIFMFIANMLCAVILLPALARFIIKPEAIRQPVILS